MVADPEDLSFYPLVDDLSKFLTGKAWGSGPHQCDVFILAVVDVLAHFRDYGIKEYGHQWFDEQDAEYGASFGLKKFAERLFKVLVTKKLPLPTAEKLKSNAMDASVYALFLVALMNTRRIKGSDNAR